MISVLLPTYNNSKYVFPAVTSIINQTYKDFEFLIIDDGSTDNTVEIIKSFSDSRIRLICRDKNRGLGDTLNEGLKLSRYPLVARMDGDDISTPDRFERQLEYLNKNPEVDILSSKYAVLIGNKIRYIVDTAESHNKIKERLALHSDIIHSGLIYKKDKILRYGGYKNIPIEDFELWLRLKDKVVFGNVPEVLLIKRYHREAISQQLEIKNQSAYNYLEPFYNNPENEFGIRQKNDYYGWREYFYGDKKMARKYFRFARFRIFTNPRILTAFIVTFIGYPQFSSFKELRLKFRLLYLLMYFKKSNIEIRRYLKKLIRN